jgi:hypothetical protein
MDRVRPTTDAQGGILRTASGITSREEWRDILVDHLEELAGRLVGPHGTPDVGGLPSGQRGEECGARRCSDIRPHPPGPGSIRGLGLTAPSIRYREGRGFHREGCKANQQERPRLLPGDHPGSAPLEADPISAELEGVRPGEAQGDVPLPIREPAAEPPALWVQQLHRGPRDRCVPVTPADRAGSGTPPRAPRGGDDGRGGRGSRASSPRHRPSAGCDDPR